MDKKYIIKTLIRRDHKFGENTYVRGRICGMKEVICKEDKLFAVCEIDEGFILTTECTAIQYDDWMNLVEKRYPGLCKFDYKESE